MTHAELGRWLDWASPESRAEVAEAAHATLTYWLFRGIPPCAATAAAAAQVEMGAIMRLWPDNPDVILVRHA